jgi:hypothetical protein
MVKKLKIKTASKPDSIFRDLLIVPKGTDEWNIMWNRLAKRRMNRRCEDPYTAENYGEVWEYMESVKTRFGFRHRFRHRLHPTKRMPVHLSIRASRGLEIVPN